MKKFGKFLVTIVALLSVFAIFAVGCDFGGSNKVQGGDGNNSGDDIDEDDGYTHIAQEEAVEFIADYAEQFLASDNAVLGYNNDVAFTGKFKSVSDSSGNLKKIAKMNSATKVTYGYLNGEKTYFEMLSYNDFDAFDEAGTKITSENDSGGVVLTDEVIYGLKYIDGDFYPVSQDSHSKDQDGDTGESSYIQSYVGNYKNQAAIYLCECAMFISNSVYGNAEKAGDLFAEKELLSLSMIDTLKTMVIGDSGSILQHIYESWGGEKQEVKTKIGIGFIKTLESELKIQIKLTPDNEGVADPAMEGETKITFTFNYAAWLDENHFNEIINKTVPQS